MQHLEKTLWTAADKMLSYMDAADYKHVMLGLIFLKYISDAFSELYETFQNDNGKSTVEVIGFDYCTPKKRTVDRIGKGYVAICMPDHDYDDTRLFPPQVFYTMAG